MRFLKRFDLFLQFFYISLFTFPKRSLCCSVLLFATLPLICWKWLILLLSVSVSSQLVSSAIYWMQRSHLIGIALEDFAVAFLCKVSVGKKGPFLLSSSTYTCTVTCTTFRTILVWMLQTRYLVCWKQSKAWFFQGRTVVLQRLLKTIIKLIPFTFFCFARHGELLLQGKGKPAQEHQIIQAAAG